MTKYTFSRLALVAASSMLFISPAMAETLRLGTVVSAPHPWLDAAEAFKAEVEEATEGRIDVQIFPGGQLGNDQTMVDEIRIGTTDMIIGGTMNISPYIPEFEIFSLNYLFEDMDKFKLATAPESPVFNYFDTAMSEAGVGLKLLSLTGGGTRNLSTNTGPVIEPSDMQGVKMRVTGSRLDADMWQSVGALTTSLPWTEIYTGLQTGVVEAFESTISGYYSSRLYEVAPYHAKTEHQVMMSHISISDNRFNRFSEDDQRIILEAAQHAGEYGTEQGIAYDAEFIQEFEDLGVTVSEVDKQAFIDAVVPLHEDFAEERGLTELLETIRNL
jgi:tripartite ATP-independent transporter DctP family solute receptor